MSKKPSRRRGRRRASFPGSRRRPGTDIRPDVLAALDRAFPDQTVEMIEDEEESWLYETWPRITARLQRIRMAHLYYADHPHPTSTADSASESPFDDPDHEEPIADDWTWSYYAVFLALAGPAYQFAVVDEEEDEEVPGQFHSVQGTRTLGWVVGVSHVAPFAAIQFEEQDENPTYGDTVPEIRHHSTNPGEPQFDEDRAILEEHGEAALAALRRLYRSIERILAAEGITVLPESELRKPIPWLEGGEETFLAPPRLTGPITVGEALFFGGP